MREEKPVGREKSAGSVAFFNFTSSAVKHTKHFFQNFWKKSNFLLSNEKERKKKHNDIENRAKKVDFGLETGAWECSGDKNVSPAISLTPVSQITIEIRQNSWNNDKNKTTAKKKRKEQCRKSENSSWEKVKTAAQKKWKQRWKKKRKLRLMIERQFVDFRKIWRLVDGKVLLLINKRTHSRNGSVCGPFSEVLQYRADPWPDRSKPLNPIPVQKDVWSLGESRGLSRSDQTPKNRYYTWS